MKHFRAVVQDTWKAKEAAIKEKLLRAKRIGLRRKLPVQNSLVRTPYSF